MKKKNALQLLAASAILCGGLACSNSDDSFVATNTGNPPSLNGRLVLRDDGQPLHPGGDVADTVEVEIFDSTGLLVFGPAFTPLASEMVFENVPDIEAGKIEIDYLRNGGFLLYRAIVTAGPEGTNVTLEDPGEQPTDPNTTRWSFTPNGNGFDLTNQVGGAETALTRPLGNLRAQSEANTSFNVKLKGVCYSPAPIQFKNVDAPAIGDLFWDSNLNVKNWFALWGNGPLPYDPKVQGRDDLGKIRDMGCNAIRTYCMLSRQLFVYDATKNPAFRPGEVPVPPNKFDHFTHKEFLDKCWNRGEKPIYVLVGIPLPSDILYRYGGASQDLKNYWDFVLEETVKDVGDHPAVIGFTLFNEIDENRSAWPGVVEGQPPSGGIQNEDSDFYYGQLKKYSDKIKSLAPTKLVGWAAHDNQPFVYYGANIPQGNPYFAQLTSIDFYGVNTYQSRELDETVLGTLPGRYGSLQGATRKPVILTEFGWPGVGHKDPANVDSLYETPQTRQAAAEVIKDMIPKAFGNDLVEGVFYFEFSDEWWKQPPYELFPGDTSRAAAWNGGPPDAGMPNGYHDQEAFGLYSTALGAGRTDPNQPPTANNRPVTPVDPYIPRTEMIDELKKAYANVQ